jgi:hypothetical protein
VGAPPVAAAAAVPALTISRIATAIETIFAAAPGRTKLFSRTASLSFDRLRS